MLDCVTNSENIVDVASLSLASKNFLISQVNLPAKDIFFFGRFLPESKTSEIQNFFCPELQVENTKLDIAQIVSENTVVSGTRGTGKTTLLKYAIQHTSPGLALWLDMIQLEFYLDFEEFLNAQVSSMTKTLPPAALEDPAQLVSNHNCIFLIDNYDYLSPLLQNQVQDFVKAMLPFGLHRFVIVSDDPFLKFRRVQLERWDRNCISDFFDLRHLEMPNCSLEERLTEHSRSAEFVAVFQDVTSCLGKIPRFAVFNKFYLTLLVKQLAIATPFQESELSSVLSRIADIPAEGIEFSEAEIYRVFDQSSKIAEVCQKDFSYQLLLSSLISTGVLQRAKSIEISRYSFCDRSVHLMLLARIYFDHRVVDGYSIKSQFLEIIPDPDYCDIIVYYLELIQEYASELFQELKQEVADLLSTFERNELEHVQRMVRWVIELQ